MRRSGVRRGASLWISFYTDNAAPAGRLLAVGERISKEIRATLHVALQIPFGNGGSPGMIVTIDGPAGSGKSSAAKTPRGPARLRVPRHRRHLPRRRPGRALRRRVVDRRRRPGPPDADAPPGDAARQGAARRRGRSGADPHAGDLAGFLDCRRPPPRPPAPAALQRQIAAGRDIVCEGRDQGTVVFPDAGCKFFLVADPEERLRRRVAELEARGETVDVEALAAARPSATSATPAATSPRWCPPPTR